MPGGQDYRKGHAEAEEKKHQGKPAIHHIEIHPLMGGGHHIQRHFHPNGLGGYLEPEGTKFSAHQGPEALQHIAKHAGIAARIEGEGEGSPGEEASENAAEERAEKE